MLKILVVLFFILKKCILFMNQIYIVAHLTEVDTGKLFLPNQGRSNKNWKFWVPLVEHLRHFKMLRRCPISPSIAFIRFCIFKVGEEAVQKTQRGQLSKKDALLKKENKTRISKNSPVRSSPVQSRKREKFCCKYTGGWVISSSFHVIVLPSPWSFPSDVPTM